jgi:hypothetical protein
MLYPIELRALGGAVLCTRGLEQQLVSGLRVNATRAALGCSTILNPDEVVELAAQPSRYASLY